MLSSDRLGRVSFAVVALILVLLANLSVVYLFNVEREGAEIALQVRELEAMVEVGRRVHSEVEVAAHYIAMAAIQNATQGLHDQSKINDIFTSMFDRFLENWFPYGAMDFIVNVTSCELHILTETRAVEDHAATSRVGEGTETGGLIDALETGVPGGIERVDRVVNYRLIGSVKYTLLKGETELKLNEEVDDELYVPFPFIDQQVKRFSLVGQGPMSEIAQILRYTLTMVAQQRVLMGYAGGEYGVPGKTTRDILSAHDVELVINLALILEQVKHFRNFDTEAVRLFDSTYFSRFNDEGCPQNSTWPECKTFERLLASYATEGTIDPADAFALFTALDKDTLRMRTLLAQALYAMTDQFLLKYMDYLGFLPAEAVANLMLKMLEGLGDAWESLVEWITGTSREAQMVRDYISELFNEMGYATNVLRPASILIPVSTYSVKNQTGATFNITIEAKKHTVGFVSRSFLAGNNALWESYYPILFSNDLKEIHDGVRDLVANIASLVANEIEDTGVFEPISLVGNIDPKDDESVLEFVERRIATAIDSVLEALRNDPRMLEGMVGNIWDKEKRMIRGIVDLIELNYGAFAPVEQCREFAEDALSGSILAEAARDPDYIHLDTTARDNLTAQLDNSIETHGWAQAAYNKAKSDDFVRFESLFAKATNMELPPENGGLYRKIVDTVVGSAGLLYLTGGFVKKFLQGLAWNDVVSDNKVLLPSNLGSFKLYEYAGLDEENAAETGELTLRVDQTPDLLEISRLSTERTTDSGLPLSGELWVDLIDPATVPSSAGSPNVHYTRLDSVSERPFETQWTVVLRGAVDLRVETVEGYYLGEDGLVPVQEKVLVPLDMELDVKVFSGWPLQDVAYASSNTFLTDVWDAIESFLEWAWDALTSIVGWVVDGVKFVLRQVAQLIDYMQAMARKVLEVVYEGLARVIDLLQGVVRGIISTIFEAVAWVLDFIPTLTFDLSMFGLRIHVGINQPNCDPLVFMVGLGSFSVRISFSEVDTEGDELPDGAPRFDILGRWHAGLGPIVTHGDIDVLMLSNDHIIEGWVEWKDVWRITIEVPVIETYYNMAGHLTTPPIPVGPIQIEFEIGFQVRFSEEPSGANIIWLIERSVEEAQRECGDLSLSLEWAVEFTMTFIYRLIDNILDEIERLLDCVIDAAVYFSVSAGAPGGFANVGMRYSLTVEGEGLRGLFDWIVRNAGEILNLLAGRATSLRIEPPPLEIMEHIFVYLDVVGFIGLPRFLASFFVGPYPAQIYFTLGLGFNLSVLGVIVGLDLGEPKAYLGARFEGLPSCILGSRYRQHGDTMDVWAVRASIVPA